MNNCSTHMCDTDSVYEQRDSKQPPPVRTPSSTTASSLGHAQPSPARGPCICSSSWNSSLQDLLKTGSSLLFWIQLRYCPYKEHFLWPHHLKQHPCPSPIPTFLPLTHSLLHYFPCFSIALAAVWYYIMHRLYSFAGLILYESGDFARLVSIISMSTLDKVLIIYF